LPTKPDNEGGVIFIWNSTALSRAKILLKDGSLQYMVSFRADEYKYII
jgi:DNA-directed RNA polymerase subunit E'/Rpb7